MKAHDDDQDPDGNLAPGAGAPVDLDRKNLEKDIKGIEERAGVGGPKEMQSKAEHDELVSIGRDIVQAIKDLTLAFNAGKAVNAGEDKAAGAKAEAKEPFDFGFAFKQNGQFDVPAIMGHEWQPDEIQDFEGMYGANFGWNLKRFFGGLKKPKKKEKPKKPKAKDLAAFEVAEEPEVGDWAEREPDEEPEEAEEEVSEDDKLNSMLFGRRKLRTDFDGYDPKIADFRGMDPSLMHTMAQTDDYAEIISLSDEYADDIRRFHGALIYVIQRMIGDLMLDHNKLEDIIRHLEQYRTSI